MPVIITYILKLSISLAIVYIFYRLVLRKLTFYNSNRWYLLMYTFLSFFIPFINISPAVEGNRIDDSFIGFIPSIEKYTGSIGSIAGCPEPLWFFSWNKWDWMLFIAATGAGGLLLRFVVRWFSFLRLRSKAILISERGMKLYQVNEPIIPFSFGNAIFINSRQHNETELQEIIRHEFVHVRQNHTMDIIWAEILCMLNWYNPFVWLLKAAIRQNLEFIADNKVLENGISKKQYQYLLLKVIGNNHFSIASQFNFSSLKKRIAMMNKMKTAKVHLLRFLFILPLLAVILLSFRKQKQQPVKETPFQQETGISAADSLPDVTEPNEKGYIINIKDNKGNCTIVIKDKSGKEVKRMLLTEWNKNEEYYENLYGNIPPPPPPAPPIPPAPPKAPKLPENVTSINVNNDKATVLLKDGTKEKYDLKIPEQKAAFEKKYGEMPAPPEAPVPPVPPSKEDAMITAEQAKNRALISNHFEITDKKAIMQLRNGTTEEYDLMNAEQRKKFESKYGRIIAVQNKETGELAPYVVLTGDGEQSVIAPMDHFNNDLTVVDPYGHVITGAEDVLVVITKNTSKEQLEEFRKQMKEKGIELKYDNVDYNDGKLVSITGTMRSADGHSNFVATDFNKLVLAMIRKGDKTYFKVSVKDNKTVI